MSKETIVSSLRKYENSFTAFLKYLDLRKIQPIDFFKMNIRQQYTFFLDFFRLGNLFIVCTTHNYLIYKDIIKPYNPETDEMYGDKPYQEFELLKEDILINDKYLDGSNYLKVTIAGFEILESGRFNELPF